MLEPDDAMAHFAAGISLRMTGRADDALRFLVRANALAPESPEIAFNLANMLHANRRYLDAVPLYLCAEGVPTLERFNIPYLRKAALAAAVSGAVETHHGKRYGDAAAAYRAIARVFPCAAPALDWALAAAADGQLPIAHGTPVDDPVFESFETTSERFDGDVAVNFMGARCRLSSDSPLHFFHANGLASGGTQIVPGRTRPLCPTEDHFEWIDLLTAVDEARERFVFVELGAGYGRWLAHAAAAVRRRRRPDPLTAILVGVEADERNYARMRQNLSDNGVHLENCRLLLAAVSDHDGELLFPIPDGERNEFGSHAVGVEGADAGRSGFRRVPALRLTSIITDELGIVDLIDMDIQGEEAKVVADSLDLFDSRVRRLHIATHGQDVERMIADHLAGRGWIPVLQLPCQPEVPQPTPYGPLCCNDGIQSWLNPRLARSRGAASP